MNENQAVVEGELLDRVLLLALHGVQADRGDFIATSSFAAVARDYAERVNARLILIEGDRLASLMVRHGVGVQAETTVTLHRLDEDFFDTL